MDRQKAYGSRRRIRVIRAPARRAPLPSMRPLVSLFALAFFLAVASVPASAQLGGGLGSLSFDYTTEGRPFAFDGRVYAFGGYWDTGRAYAFYGTDARVDILTADSVTTTAIGADLYAEKAYPLVRLGEAGPQTTIALPTTGEIAYRYVRDGSLNEVDDEGSQSLHLGLATVGLGGRATVAFPFAEDGLADEATASMALLFGAGSQTRLDDALATRFDGDGETVEGNGVYGVRSRTLSLDVRLNEILGETLGLRAGYAVRTLWTGADAFDAPLDVLGVVRGGDAYTQFETRRILRLGLTF